MLRQVFVLKGNEIIYRRSYGNALNNAEIILSLIIILYKNYEKSQELILTFNILDFKRS